MVEATHIQSGMLVRTSFGVKLGRVAGVQAGTVKVRRGAIFSREVDVPIEDIEAIEGDELVISESVADLYSGKRYSLKERPQLHLRERAHNIDRDARLSGSERGSVSVERDEVSTTTGEGNARIAYRESLVGITGDEVEVRAWTSEGPMLSNALAREKRSSSEEYSEEDEDRDQREGVIESSQAEHPG